MSISVIPNQLCWPTLPLSVYREIAAHLRQVSDVEVDCIEQTATDFDYTSSQVGGLTIQLSPSAPPEAYRKILEILEYYRSRFGPWQTME